MFQILTYLLACSMGLAHAVGQTTIVLPDVVKALGAQCKDRGPYEGACTSQNVDSSFGSGFSCSNLICARRVPGPVVEYEAVATGRPVDGTQCRRFYVCVKGQCLFAGPRSVPAQEGSGPSLRCLQSVIQQAPTPPPTRKTVIAIPRRKQSATKRSDLNA